MLGVAPWSIHLLWRVNGGLNLSKLDGWWAEAYSPDVGCALGDMREHGETLGGPFHLVARIAFLAVTEADVKENRTTESRRGSRALERGTASMSRESIIVPPFPSDYLASGMLLHLTSLPSIYGIGDFGTVALSWIDRLCQAGQNWWQLLPLGPTAYDNSPYQSLCSFAGNALLIGPDWL